MDPFDMSNREICDKTHAEASPAQEVWGCCSSKNPCETHLKQRAEGWQKLHDEVLQRLKALEAENLQLAKENKELHYWRQEMERVMGGLPEVKSYKAKEYSYGSTDKALLDRS